MTRSSRGRNTSPSSGANIGRGSRLGHAYRAAMSASASASLYESWRIPVNLTTTADDLSAVSRNARVTAVSLLRGQLQPASARVAREAA